METIEYIEQQIQDIIKEYSNTYYPKKYISDVRYRKLKLEKQKLQIALSEKDKPKIKIKSNKQENFESLSNEVQEKLLAANYNIEFDPDNILSFYPTSINSDLGKKIMRDKIIYLQERCNLNR